jgi:hypothetical protein
VAYIYDPLPALVEFGGELECSIDGCGYDPEQRLVYWVGPAQNGEEVVLQFIVYVPEDIPPTTTEIVNEVLIFDGADEHEVMEVTEVNAGAM